ncbi:hypothetical protein NQ318_002824 [Aromia moschata]|uniref:Integrase catalytic domain-containing protein n=1 Tax=Aromia moschata TaxID=1265417 RepID=A0AAV8X6R7_9CUCU|nr:hypothetical protein NQ318_002824 [Aromia moschata]
MKIMGIKKTRTTALHPQSNGMVERHNRTICHYLSKFVSENQRDWDKLVPLFLLSYRSSQHESTTYTPSMLTSGREMKLPTDLILGHPVEENQERSLPEFVEDLRERMDRIHQFAREKLKIHSDKMKQRLDTTSTKTAFKPGDAVWLYAPKRTKGKSKASEQLGRPVHHNKENQRPGLLHPAVSKKQAEGGPSGKARKSTQDIIHPIGLSSKIHRLGLKTVLFGTNNFEEGSSVTFVKVTFVTADIY